MDKTTFDAIRKIVYEKSGINLKPGKESLVSARVGKRMRALNLTDHEEYLRCINNDSSGKEVVSLIDAISTNVTSFFREAHHFSLLDELFREWLAAGQTRFRFWSAASSTGEEPYSLAMTLLEALNGQRPDIKILASDISTQALGACQAGIYEKRKLEEISPFLLNRYFQPCKNGLPDSYVVDKKLKDWLVYKRINLSSTPFPMRGPFDVIFCRNVMIYFDKQVRQRLLAELYRLLKPGGYVFVGHAESLAATTSDFKVVQPSVFQKP